MRPSGRITSPDVKPGCRPGGAYHEKFHINIYIYIYIYIYTYMKLTIINVRPKAAQIFFAAL